MKKGKRLLSSLLAVVLCLSLLPVTGLAAEDAEDVTLSYEGVTYFDVGSDHFEDSTRLFIQDLMSAKSIHLDDQSTAALWQYLAYTIQDSNGTGTSDGKFKTQFDNAITNGLAVNAEEDSGSSNVSSGDNNYDVRWSGLSYASSIAKAAQDMEDTLFSWYRSAGGGRDDQYPDDDQGDDDAAIKHNAQLAEYNNTQDCFWMFTGALKTSGTNKKGHYQALGVIFSDFSVTPVLPEYNQDYYQTTKEEPVTGGRDFLSNVQNDTNVTVTQSQGLDKSTTTTMTSSISGSDTYTYHEAITIGMGASISKVSINGSVSAAFTQAIQSGWSESESTSETVTEHSTASVTLPPFTHVMLNQYDSETTTTTHYDCPVALNFNVTIVEYTLDPSSNNASCKTKILASFEGTGREDLYQRAVVEQDLVDGDRINWNTLFKAHSDLEGRVDSIALTAPMSTTGAVFTIKEESLTTSVKGLMPSYPLDRVATSNNLQWITVSPGAPYYLSNISLTGYNRYNGEYYGFNKLKGHWILLDEQGNELTDSNIAHLVTDPVSGFTRLEAGTQNGTVYLKYLIDEDCYNSAESQEHYTKNYELSKTAVIEVFVQLAEDVFESGNIYVDGQLSGIVGDEPKAIEGEDGFAVRMEDSTGKEVSYPVVWEAKELNGITVEDNMISFTAPGTYHVRASSGNVLSDWVEVTALPARQLDEVLIPDTLEMDTRVDTFCDLSTIQVRTYDQYGDVYDTDSQVVWTCTSGSGTIDEDNYFTAPTSGTYQLEAMVDGVVSNTMTVTVVSDTVRAMQWIFDSGVTASDSMDEFNTASICTRAHAMTFLWRAAGSPAPESDTMPFTDVADDAYYRDAVLWAVENGVTNGTSATTFSPDQNCTRAQLVTFLWNYEGQPKVSMGNDFTDVADGAYYEGSVNWASFYDITKGVSDTTFGPDNGCARGQAVTFLYRFFEKYL